MDLYIRDATPDDAAAILAVFNPIIESGLYTVFDTPFTTEFERAYIQNLPERAIFHVAVRQTDQKIVGFQSMEPFATYTQAFAHVGTLGTYVDLSQNRQGIASSLFAATFAAAIDKGYEKIFTFVRADNPAALQTYLRHGFEIIGMARKQAKFNGGYIDEIMIEKML